jgi:hypothetical protein
MAHYAFLDENNIVTEVITGKDESNFDWEQKYGFMRGQLCKRTSYNTHGNQHPEGNPFRGNYAGIGFTYDATNDVFYAPQPYPSWILNNNTWLWEAPVPYPADNKNYKWDESTTNWVEQV